jgi:methyl-accepting chemotaxis protein
MTSNTTFKWRNLSLALRLPIDVFIVVTVLLTGFVTAISYTLMNEAELRAEKELASKSQLMVDMMASADSNLRQRVDVLTKAFQSRLVGQFTLDTTVTEVNGKPAPTLKLDGKVMNMNFSIPDDFTQSTGAVATLFARQGEDFIRVTTSLKNTKGERAIGTLLDRSHPGYKAVLEGKSYTGSAALFGKVYETQYEPILDEHGKNIGVVFVGLDYSDLEAQFKQTLRNQVIGTSGYFFVLNNRKGPDYGKLLVHPSLEGKNLMETQDADGKLFVQEILDKKTGVTNYRWQNKDAGETVPKEKLAVYSLFKSWEWVVVGTYYTDDFTRDVRQANYKYVVLGAVLVLILSGILYFLIRKTIILPLRKAMREARAIAEGDLTTSIDVDSNNEIGQLITSMNQISQGLASVVRSVRTGAEGVALASGEIAQGNQDLSGRTESQASALEETAASMEQLAATVQQNAESAQQANLLAQSASTVATKGGQAVGKVVDTMKGITDSSRKIEDIISVIDSIAFQTNILALNAAVEAARAGEQGRGFAVVATEVRSLAQRSAEAAKEIKVLITDSAQRVEQGTKFVNDAGETMQEVVNSIQRVTSIMGDISVASREQSEGVAQVGEAVSNMDEVTQRNAALVEEISAAADGLQSQAKELVQMVAVFKV